MSARPTGVTILAILEFIGGIFGLIGGGLSMMLAMVAMQYDPSLGTVLLIFALIPLLIGIIDFIIGWGLWTLKSWAWLLALIFGIIGLIFGIIGLNIIGIIINLIIVLYLWQPDVKAAFGR